MVSSHETNSVAVCFEFQASRIPLNSSRSVQVAAAAKKPVVLVTLTAVPLDISEILANPKAWTVKMGPV